MGDGRDDGINIEEPVHKPNGMDFRTTRNNIGFRAVGPDCRRARRRRRRYTATRIFCKTENAQIDLIILWARYGMFSERQLLQRRKSVDGLVKFNHHRGYNNIRVT